MKEQIVNQTFDEERSLYNISNTEVLNCTFAGEADGESVLKECRKIDIKNCSFSLRYPLWHAKKFLLLDSSMDELTRAPLWYSVNGKIENCKIIGTQPLCYCKNLKLIHCTMESTDLSFEYSDVDADIIGHIISIKNPKSGTIIVDSVDEIIAEDAVMKCEGKVILRNQEVEKIA